MSWLGEFARGAALGTGMLPGVSVGTVGIIVGVYDRLISSINGLLKSFWKNFLILFPIALGCVISAVLVIVLQDYAYDVIPLEMTGLCAGFVLGGTPIVLKDIDKKNLTFTRIIKVLVGFLVASAIGILSIIAKKYWGIDLSFAFENPESNPWIFPVCTLIGLVAAVGCLLPGISGSMILFIFGLYDPVVALYTKDNSMFHNPSRIGSGLILTALLLIGIVIGLFGTAKLMRGLLDKHKQGTYLVVLGFMLGSIVSMFFNKDIWADYPDAERFHYVLMAGAFILAFGIMLMLINKTPSKENE